MGWAAERRFLQQTAPRFPAGAGEDIMATWLFRTVFAAGTVVLAAGCGSPAGPSDTVGAMAGSWGGTALLPAARGAGMTLQQTGSAVTGTMSLGGVFLDRPLTGTYASSTRTFTWSVGFNCETWTGQMMLEGAGGSLAGTIRRDGRGCVPPVSDVNGTLSLDRR
jgi:hypothetical protein